MRIRPIMVLSIIALIAAAPSGAATDACKKTSKAAFGACKEAAKHDQLIAKGTCANDPDRDSAKACTQQASADAKDEVQSCKDQADYRKVVCGRLGPAPYVPAIDTANFTSSTTIDQPILPARARNDVHLRGPDRRRVRARRVRRDARTKVILGITCVEVHDTAALDGVLSEDTRDWFAQDDDGNVWYFGENTAIIDNGLPVDLSGSWTGGVAGAQARHRHGGDPGGRRLLSPGVLARERRGPRRGDEPHRVRRPCRPRRAPATAWRPRSRRRSTRKTSSTSSTSPASATFRPSTSRRASTRTSSRSRPAIRTRAPCRLFATSVGGGDAQPGRADVGIEAPAGPRMPRHRQLVGVTSQARSSLDATGMPSGRGHPESSDTSRRCPSGPSR